MTLVSCCLPQVLLKGFRVHLRDMCPRKGGQQSLEDFVTIPDRQVLMLVQEVLCQAPPIWLDHAEEHFQNNLDFFKPIQVKDTCCQASGHMTISCLASVLSEGQGQEQ